MHLYRAQKLDFYHKFAFEIKFFSWFYLKKYLDILTPNFKRKSRNERNIKQNKNARLRLRRGQSAQKFRAFKTSQDWERREGTSRPKRLKSALATFWPLFVNPILRSELFVGAAGLNILILWNSRPEAYPEHTYQSML